MGTVVSGVIPLINAELLVVGAAAVATGPWVPIVAAVSTLGQMITKTILFALARWAPSRLPANVARRLEAASRVVRERGGGAGSLVFTSALVGLPPFYGVSLACGALHMKLATFVWTGTAGRSVRFGILAGAGWCFGSGALDRLADSAWAALLFGS